MDEAGRCDRIALIQKGHILDIDSLKGILSKFKKTLFAVRSKEMFRLLHDLRSYPLTDTCFAFGEYLHLSLKNGEAGADEVQQFLIQKNHVQVLFKRVEPTIEDAFIQLMEDKEHA
jgi:ABC-type multidrug transport system ATPase subunit